MTRDPSDFSPRSTEVLPPHVPVGELAGAAIEWALAFAETAPQSAPMRAMEEACAVVEAAPQMPEPLPMILTTSTTSRPECPPTTSQPPAAQTVGCAHPEIECPKPCGCAPWCYCRVFTREAIDAVQTAQRPPEGVSAAGDSLPSIAKQVIRQKEVIPSSYDANDDKYVEINGVPAKLMFVSRAQAIAWIWRRCWERAGNPWLTRAAKRGQR